jgi:DNA-directed RNA polymerase specialized sigma24 family protein
MTEPKLETCADHLNKIEALEKQVKDLTADVERLENQHGKVDAALPPDCHLAQIFHEHAVSEGPRADRRAVGGGPEPVQEPPGGRDRSGAPSRSRGARVMSVDLGEIVETLARRYAARCWWADECDLVQEGWVAALQVNLRELDPAGASGYVYRVVACRMSRYLWAESSPVPSSRGDRAMAGLQRAPLEDWTVPASGTTPEALCEDAEARALELELREELRERIREIGRGAVALDAVLMVLLDGTAPSVAAWMTGVPVRVVYRETEWIKRESSGDLVTRVLMESLVDRRRDLLWT